MKTFATVILPGLSIASAFAAGSSPCPSGQQLLDNKKCCPGPLVGNADGSGGDYCCVIAGGLGSGTIDLKNPNCVARISLDDPDYDNKVKNAMGSSATGTSGTVTQTLIILANSASPTSDVATSSDTRAGSTATATTASTAQNTGAAGIVGVDMMIAGLVGLSAVFVGM